ncbi:HAD hydrolase-like protein [Actinomadura sp. CNU-125]|uniref:HAD hydrolase-like protein n=1 Tax=Actinomadura sp. CNU-125 TaxID=1904961 RepID=UPI000B2EF4CB|nr:HAD hydrolase-like protein [Actinomadura sp. CNU-125]
MTILVLWDIDHTLLSIGPLSGELYRDTFMKVTTRPFERLADMTGRTDLAITSETLRLHDIIPTEPLLASFAAALAAAFDTSRDRLATEGHALLGARDALQALAGRDDVIQSVLTGNAEPIARCKLTAFDLDRFVDLDIGAYGMDGAERPPLVALARRRAQRKHGLTFDATTTVLIGDTPKDVEAGHQGGARVVAVATGSSSIEDLKAAGAELVLPDLSDTKAVVTAVLDVTGP